MRPFDEHGRDSGGAPVSSAPHAGAEGPGATPEVTPNKKRGSADTPAEESQEAAASVPAGEPEAPVSPAAHEAAAHEAAAHQPAAHQPAAHEAAHEPAAYEPGTQEPVAQEPAEEEAPNGHPDERQLERDLDELTAKAQKADEYLELAQRTRADFDNYRKRAAREAAAAQERGVVKLVKELLPAVDNLDRALTAVSASANGDSTDELVSGLKLVHAEVIAALNRAGVELYSPAGERFDPTRHEAVAQQPADGAEPGTVIEVYQRGCRLGDSVIRPARVVVAG